MPSMQLIIFETWRVAFTALHGCMGKSVKTAVRVADFVVATRLLQLGYVDACSEGVGNAVCGVTFPLKTC